MDPEEAIVWITENCEGGDDFLQQMTVAALQPGFNAEEWTQEFMLNNCPDMGDHDTTTDAHNYDHCTEDDWECEEGECEAGEYCYIYSCQNDCNYETYCEQSYLQTWDSDWEYFDCSEGLVEIQPNCTEVCEYEDCSVERGVTPCWIEECDDKCGTYNCSVWYQQNGQWVGEFCPEEESIVSALPDFRLQDVQDSAKSIGDQYSSTLESVAKAFCEEGDESCINAPQGIFDFIGQPTKVDENQDGSVVEGTIDQGFGLLGGLAEANPAITDIFNSVLQDSGLSAPSSEEAAESVTVADGLSFVDMLIPEDNKELNNFWGAFKSGFVNSGDERKGKREGN